MEGGSTMESSLSMSLSSLEQPAEESQITGGSKTFQIPHTHGVCVVQMRSG